MKILFRKIANLILPKSTYLPVQFYYHRMRGWLEPELFALNSILKNKRRFIDIGVNIGTYSYYFSDKFNHIDGFEPILEITNRLKDLNKNNITIHPVALSDTSGELILNIPKVNGQLEPALASIERRHAENEQRKITVCRLDDYNFSEVDFIKIDVEGHELNVIQGAQKTISKNKPILLIEIEQRHLTFPMHDVFNAIINLGYQGHFIRGRKLLSISSFSLDADQLQFINDVKNPKYINNFIFQPTA